MTTAIATMITMLEQLPETTQHQVVDHLRHYLADLESEQPTTASKSLRPWGLAKGLLTVPDDFNDPLPEYIVREFEGL